MAGAEDKTVKFMEELPDCAGPCPPPGAGPFAYEIVYRFVNSNPVTDEDFASHKALEWRTSKKRPRSVPPCVWSATSLFLNRNSAYEVLPKIRDHVKFLAQ